jgi:hypothetical protein
LLLDGVHLRHHAVDFKRQRIALGFPLAAELGQFVDIGAALPITIHFEPELGQFLQRGVLRGRGQRGIVIQKIREVLQLPRRRDRRIQNAQRPGGCIARVRETREILSVAFGV